MAEFIIFAAVLYGLACIDENLIDHALSAFIALLVIGFGLFVWLLWLLVRGG